VDCLGGDLRGLVFGVEQGALGGETLLRTGHIVADMRERAVGQYDFAGCDFHELEAPTAATSLRQSFSR
jgi:hypothetical protein